MFHGFSGDFKDSLEGPHTFNRCVDKLIVWYELVITTMWKIGDFMSMRISLDLGILSSMILDYNGLYFFVQLNVNQLYVELNVWKNDGKGNWASKMNFGMLRFA